MQEIENNDVISFNYKRTKIEQVYTKIEFRYNWDYARKEFNEKVTYSLEEGEADILPVVGVDGYLHDYYGFKEIEDDPHAESTLVIDDDRGKYIRHDTTAEEFARWMLRWHCNQHLTIDIKLPLKYIKLEVGQTITFPEVLGNSVLPYGIDYSRDATFPGNGIGSLVNGQQAFPVFMITSTNKQITHINISCIQLHNLTATHRTRGDVQGCMLPGSWNYDENANIEGTCYNAESFLQHNVCPYEANPTGEADDPDIQYYATNYPDDGVDLSEGSGNFLYTEEGIEAARIYFNDGGIPNIYDYSQCLWSDTINHSIHSIHVWILTLTGDYSVGDFGGTTGFVVDMDTDSPYCHIMLNEAILNYYNENEKLVVKITYRFEENTPTFRGDSIFQHQYVNATPGSSAEGDTIYAPSIPPTDVYGTLGSYDVDMEFHKDQLDLESEYSPDEAGQVDTVNATYSLSVSPVVEDNSEGYFEIHPTNFQIIFTGFEPPNNLGDVTGDGAWNILDIVTLAACVLNGNCADLAYSQNTDLNQDGTVNILDIVILSMCVLHIDCGSL